MEHDAGKSIDLADAEMRAVEIGGRKILLARVNGACHAIENLCPHAGAPLDQGVLRGELVICPWHKAAFCLATGRLREPPAVDDVRRFPVREAGGRILVEIGDARQPAHAGLSVAQGEEHRDTPVFAIVGAGAAGAVAAQTLREEGFSGRVVLIGREDLLPYDRTILSKYALSGKPGAEKTPLQDEKYYRQKRIERVTDDVLSIDPVSRRISFATRPPLTYDKALLAPGGAPRQPGIEGASLQGVFTLRSAADARAIAAAAGKARKAVVAGSGFIAMEAAASLRERGLEVIVVAPQAEPFERQLGRDIGRIFRRVHEGQGIQFRMDDEIVAMEGDGHVQRVRLRDGDCVDTDLAVFGLGVAPATEILHGVGHRDAHGGIPVDSRLRVTEGLYAAGDVAAFPAYGDGERIRVEHWRVAQQHGRVAALNMMGGNAVYDAVPYFWTIHFMKRLDYVGHAETWDQVVIEGDLHKPQFLAFYVRNGSVAAVAGWNRDRQMAACIMLLTERRIWPHSELREALMRWG